MNNEQGRLALAFVLTGAIFFSWQYFFSPKPIPQPVTNVTVNSTAVSTPAVTATTSASTPEQDHIAEVREFKLSNANNMVVLNNKLSVSDFSNSNVQKKFSEIIESKNPLKIWISEGPNKEWKEVILNDLNTQGEQNLLGSNSQLGINSAQVSLLESKVNTSLQFDRPKLVRIEFASLKAHTEGNRFREFILLDKDVTRFHVGDKKDGDLELKWAGVDYNYHIFNLILAEKIPAKYTSLEDGRLVVELTKEVQTLKFDLVFTPKNYDHLIKLGDKLELAVDFGMFGVLAVPMLHVLQFFYKILPNYGLAIILLTIVLRLITFPLMYSSFKNMKKMQIIQPELAKIREKFKDDPQRMQKESMDLFKKSGANPLNGCLPMLLQIPFFFAFYKMLNGAIELVGAPFLFWIKDLSLKDPFYVLPLLMTVTFFVQQKLTPNASMDPMQRKMMLFMPLIFGLIMKDLPSGLTLYIFVSTLFGIGQQYLVGKTT